MHIFKTISALCAQLKSLPKKSLGFIPTMGALHAGHLSLVKTAKNESEQVIVSIFVNPTQFGPQEDFSRYPRNLKHDLKLLKKAKVDYVFVPKVKEIYGTKTLTSVQVTEITQKLCGLSRPTHFQGVATIVAKLFNIIRPQKAYFGQKDYQQVLVIKKMVEDLNFDLEIRMCPNVREKDGLALSSRNRYLSKSEHKEAVILSQSLLLAQELIKNGKRDSKKIRQKIIENITKNSRGKIDYVEILRADDLSNLQKISGKIVIALAVFFGKTRLIDNVII